MLPNILQMEISLQALLFVLSLVLLVWFAAKAHIPRSRRPIDVIPISLPKQNHFILGHASLLGSGILDGLHRLCVDCQTKDGLSRFYLMNVECIGILRPEHVQIALNSGNYRKPIPIIHTHFDKLLGAKSLVTLMKDQWSSMRKIVVRAFSLNYLTASCLDIGQVSHEFVSSLRKLDGQEVDMWSITKVRSAALIMQRTVGCARQPLLRSAAPWTSSAGLPLAMIFYAANLCGPRL